jgi:hypothetical protein
MSLPVMTPEQREQALARALAVRHARAAMLARLKRGETTFADVLASAETEDSPMRKARVRAVLRKLPGVGPVKAKGLMDELGINEKRTLGGLGPKQRKALAGRLAAPAKESGSAPGYKLYRDETACDSNDFGPPHGEYPTLALAMVAAGLPVSAWHTGRHCPDEIFTCKPDSAEVDWQILAPGAAAEFAALAAT